MYESDSGIEEMLRRLGPPGGDESPQGLATSSDFSLGVEWLAEQMRIFVDLHPDWEDSVGSLASFLARADDDIDAAH
jgi:hypothetical protein